MSKAEKRPHFYPHRIVPRGHVLMPMLRVLQQNTICASLRCNTSCSIVNFLSSSCWWQIQYYITTTVCKKKWCKHIGNTNTSGCIINHAQDDRTVLGNWGKSINLLFGIKGCVKYKLCKVLSAVPRWKIHWGGIFGGASAETIGLCCLLYTFTLSWVNPLALSQPPMCTGPTDAISICCNYRRPHCLHTLSKHIHMQNTLPTGVIHAA